MSSTIVEITKNPRNSKTAADTGTIFRMSIFLPRAFSMSRIARCPPSNGGSGTRLMMPMKSVTYAKTQKNAAQFPVEPIAGGRARTYPDQNASQAKAKRVLLPEASRPEPS